MKTNKQNWDNVITKDEDHVKLLVTHTRASLDWFNQAATTLVNLAQDTKTIESIKETEIRSLKTAYDTASKPFNTLLSRIKKIDTALRQKFLDLYPHGNSHVVEGVGEVVIKRPWGYEVTDITKVPREYLTVDSGKVMTAIGEGTRVIPGLDIKQGKSITVLTASK